MARKKTMAAIPAETLPLDAAPGEGSLAGGYSPADETEQELPVDVVTAPTHVVDPEHKDIGQWAATYWRGRAIWRHKRSGQTLFKRSEVWRLRNLK